MLYRRLAVLIVLGSCALTAAEQWIRLTTPHFELYTSAGEKKGREAILYFEQVRSFFLAASPSKRVPDFPVRIIAFRGEKQFKPYRVNDFSAAYYTGSHERDYIVMGDIAPDHYPIAIHEYTHLIINHTGLKLPLWMDEGWADLYSSLLPMGKKALVGSLLPGRVQTMLNSTWIPLDALSSVNHDSPLYNERQKAGVFYAQSWALLHMLYLGKRYSPNFPKFVQSMSTGMSMADACDKALGVPIAAVEKDLHQYLTSNQLLGALFDVKIEKSAEEAAVSEPSDFETGMMLADLSAMIHKPDQARGAYSQLAKEYPDRPEVEESLGYLAWQERDNNGARDHFAKAFAAGDKNPMMCYHYASLAGTGDESIAALKRAVAFKPDYTDARLQLGSRLMSKQDYNGAAAALRPIKRVNEQQAEWYFAALAFIDLRIGDKESARKNARFAQQWAKTPQQTEQAMELLRYLDQMDRPADERPHITRQESPKSTFTVFEDDPVDTVEGTAQKLDCSDNGAKLTVSTSAGLMTFDIPDPGAVSIKHSGKVAHEFTCDPQSGYHVVVGYKKAETAGPSASVVKTLEF